MNRYVIGAIIILSAAIIGIIGYNSESFVIDYGEPAAQFLEQEVEQKATNYIGKKISVKGIVTKLDNNKGGDSWIHLGEHTHCNFGKFTAMAEEYKIGDTVFVDGILKTCEKDNVILNPAIGRDPTAQFDPR